MVYFIKKAEARAEFAERSVQKLQKEVDRLEGAYSVMLYLIKPKIVAFLFRFIIKPKVLAFLFRFIIKPKVVTFIFSICIKGKSAGFLLLKKLFVINV